MTFVVYFLFFFYSGIRRATRHASIDAVIGKIVEVCFGKPWQLGVETFPLRLAVAMTFANNARFIKRRNVFIPTYRLMRWPFQIGGMEDAGEFMWRDRERKLKTNPLIERLLFVCRKELLILRIVFFIKNYMSKSMGHIIVATQHFCYSLLFFHHLCLLGGTLTFYKFNYSWRKTLQRKLIMWANHSLITPPSAITWGAVVHSWHSWLGPHRNNRLDLNFQSQS